ncbi:fructosyl amine:oxygen oxidoreductase [Pyrenophora seminiperda CCB06]|uniref:Fructosyl amine:oxygen oxidoreductase n=1 Tax=Pyrenophora seminiperda CCB06 TaxID=1302712 RepID=A0A3M7M734_9PLEO|nr:fructosyl amine:oxygen oxidoreductase [Pyrenophora seminiperda CCB06]
MSSTSNSSLLIIGAGTWGCSIALELARRRHTSITVLDGSPFPSPISAGNDLNKIAEEGNEPSDSDSDEEYFWNKVTQIATHAWKHDPLFSPLYHDTGFIMAAVSDEAYARCVEYAKGETPTPIALKTKEDFQKTMPEGVLQGAFPGWRGFWKKQGAGWVFASGTLKAMHQEAMKLGVKFVTGIAGKVEELLYTSDNTVRGVKTANGSEYTAEHVILSAGANSELLLDFRKQLRPTSWTLAHLPLSVDEAALYRNLPVLYGVDRGFFIEPDVEKHEIKLCDEHPGYINPEVNNGELHSVPFSREQIPKEAEARMRRLLSETMPQFVDRPLSFARICWDADTVDRVFLIDKHPDVSNLIVAVGGSGNGFMACPAVGKLVADIFEAKGDGRLKKLMRWRPEIAMERDWWDAQGRYGANGKIMNFQQVDKWTTIGK